MRYILFIFCCCLLLCGAFSRALIFQQNYLLLIISIAWRYDLLIYMLTLDMEA
jgi:hypothetical protein